MNICKQLLFIFHQHFLKETGFYSPVYSRAHGIAVTCCVEEQFLMTSKSTSPHDTIVKQMLFKKRTWCLFTFLSLKTQKSSKPYETYLMVIVEHQHITQIWLRTRNYHLCLLMNCLKFCCLKESQNIYQHITQCKSRK